MKRNHGWMHSLPMFTHFYRQPASALLLHFSRGNRRPVERVALPRGIARIVQSVVSKYSGDTNVSEIYTGARENQKQNYELSAIENIKTCTALKNASWKCRYIIGNRECTLTLR